MSRAWWPLPDPQPAREPADLFLPHGTGEQLDTVERAIARCDFPWHHLSVPLLTETGRERAPVEWRPIRRDPRRVDVTDPITGERADPIVDPAGRSVVALAWWSGRITVHDRLPVRLREPAFLAAAAHLIDRLRLGHTDRARVWNALHPPDERVGDPQPGAAPVWAPWVRSVWPAAFLAAFTPHPPTVLYPDAHINARAARAVRAVFLPDEAPPAELVAASRRVYHDPACPLFRRLPVRGERLGYIDPPDRRPCRLCRPDQEQP